MFVDEEHRPENTDRVRRLAALASSARTLARFDQEREYRPSVFSSLGTLFPAPKFQLSLKLSSRMSALWFHIHANSFCHNPLVLILMQTAPGVYQLPLLPLRYQGITKPFLAHQVRLMRAPTKAGGGRRQNRCHGGLEVN
jgi:hypothetical protein